jgi:hypothetical protein
MAEFNAQQRYEVFVENQGVPGDAPPDPTPDLKIGDITPQLIEEHLQAGLPQYIPPVEVLYRSFELVDQSRGSLSPVELFLLFFGPVVLLLLHHTNIAIQGQQWKGRPIRQLVEVEIRRWIAIRIEMAKFGVRNASFRSNWGRSNTSTKWLTLNRFLMIEHFICLCNDKVALANQDPWYWKVQNGLNSVRQAFQQLLIPSSHICVDESAIKFHGRTYQAYDLSHKPAKRGFVIYPLTSYGGIIHDFAVSSRQYGIEGVERGISIELATRSTRTRIASHQGQSAVEVHLPPLKSMVYKLCEALRTRFPGQKYVCFVDNAFTDVPLARALIGLDIGLCGTVRKNSKGFPVILQAIKYEYPHLLAENRLASKIVHQNVNCVVWNDHLNGNIVSFISTVHRNTSTINTTRSYEPTNATRAHQKGFARLNMDQPAIPVDYNTYMGSTDLTNRYRSYSTTRIAGQRKWTKKMLEFMIDMCQINAYLVYNRYQPPPHVRDDSHELFIKGLVAGLIHQQEEVHTPQERSKSVYCSWRGCQPRAYTRPTPLGRVVNNMTPARGGRTFDWCTKCGKAFCITRGCWRAYHDHYDLPTRPQDRY